MGNISTTVHKWFRDSVKITTNANMHVLLSALASKLKRFEEKKLKTNLATQ